MTDKCREALAELLALYEHNGYAAPIDLANSRDTSEREKSAWTAARAALAQPAPVVDVRQALFDARWAMSHAVPTGEITLKEWDIVRAKVQEAIDAHPAPAEPAALTDAQIVEIAESCGYDGAVPTVRLAFHGFRLWDFARAIERAIRSKA